MKHYQSHKIVEAAPIKGVWPAPHGYDVHTEGHVHATSGQLFARGMPVVGDYLVRYQPDGYLSWSPKAVFEAGYTPIEDKPTTWQERAVLELNELGVRTQGLGKALLDGVVTDEHVKALMQAQYKAMVAYHDALSMRLRVCGVIDAETEPHIRVYGEQRAEVRETSGAWIGEGPAPASVAEAARGTPACVEVTVSAPAGKRAEVSLGGPMGHPMRWTVTEGQTQSWSVIGGEQLTVTQASTSTVAHKRETD